MYFITPRGQKPNYVGQNSHNTERVQSNLFINFDWFVTTANQTDLDRTEQVRRCCEWNLCQVWQILPPPAHNWQKDWASDQSAPRDTRGRSLSYLDCYIRWLGALPTAFDLDVKYRYRLTGSVAGCGELDPGPGQLQSARERRTVGQVIERHTEKVRLFLKSFGSCSRTSYKRTCQAAQSFPSGRWGGIGSRRLSLPRRLEWQKRRHGGPGPSAWSGFWCKHLAGENQRSDRNSPVMNMSIVPAHLSGRSPGGQNVAVCWCKTPPPPRGCRGLMPSSVGTWWRHRNAPRPGRPPW